jgi:hypothetical protein
MTRNNPRRTIAEALGQGTIWECQEQHFHGLFVLPRAVRNHFSKAHTVGTFENWEPKIQCFGQTWKFGIEETSDSGDRG